VVDASIEAGPNGDNLEPERARADTGKLPLGDVDPVFQSTLPR
jgi:hypothetical protein